MTKLDSQGKSQLRYETVEELFNVKKKTLRMCITTMKKDLPIVKLILTSTIGIDLARHNKEPSPKKVQRMMNYMITALNGLLKHNNDPNIPIPWISNMIHTCKGNGGWYHKYKYLKDGCHYNRAMKDIVVKQITKAMLKL